MLAFGSKKDILNHEKHGIGLGDAEELFSEHHIERIDDRFDYGEERRIAMGPINGRIHVCIYTWRDGVRWIISLRKANRREVDVFQTTSRTR